MSHLGPLVSPFVDGQLSPARMAKAQLHLDVCTLCCTQVAAERSCRDVARSAPPVPVNPDFTDRLLAMSMATCGSAPDADARARALRLARTRVLTGAVASAGVFAVALFVLGGQRHIIDDPTAMVSAAADSGTHTVATATAPARNVPVDTGEKLSGTVLDWMASSGWSAPSELPDGMRVENVIVAEDSGAQVLRLDLVNGSDVVHVLEQRGELDPALTANRTPVEVGGHLAYDVGENWWMAQCGGSVVAMNSGHNPEAAYALLARMLDAQGDGLTDRIANGFNVLVAGS